MKRRRMAPVGGTKASRARYERYLRSVSLPGWAHHELDCYDLYHDGRFVTRALRQPDGRYVLLVAVEPNTYDVRTREGAHVGAHTQPRIR